MLILCFCCGLYKLHVPLTFQCIVDLKGNNKNLHGIFLVELTNLRGCNTSFRKPV